MFKLSFPDRVGGASIHSSVDLASDHKRRVRMKLSLSKERQMGNSSENNMNATNYPSTPNPELLKSPKELEEFEDGSGNCDVEVNYQPKLEFDTLSKFESLKHTISESRSNLVNLSSQLKPKEKFHISHKDSAIESLKAIERKIEKASDSTLKGNYPKANSELKSNVKKPETSKVDTFKRASFMEYEEHLVPVSSQDKKYSIKGILERCTTLRYSSQQGNNAERFIISEEESSELKNSQIVRFCQSTEFSIIPSNTKPERDKPQLLEPSSPSSEMVIQQMMREQRPSIGVQIDIPSSNSQRNPSLYPPISFDSLISELESIKEEKDSALQLSDPSAVFNLRTELNRRHDEKMKNLVSVLLRECGISPMADLQSSMRLLFENISSISNIENSTRDKVIRFFLKEYNRMQELAKQRIEQFDDEMPVKQEKSTSRKPQTQKLGKRMQTRNLLPKRNLKKAMTTKK